jgi:hypothetical protein
LPTSRVHTPLPRPKVVALPRRMTSSTPVNGTAEMTGAEDLFLGNPHVIAHIGIDCRRNKVSLGERAFGQLLATNNRSCALLAGNVEVAGDAFELLLRDQRTDLGVGVDAVADLETLAEIGDAADKLLINLALDKKPGPGAADLFRIGEHRHAGAWYRAFEIGIGKHDVR